MRNTGRRCANGFAVAVWITGCNHIADLNSSTDHLRSRAALTEVTVSGRRRGSAGKPAVAATRIPPAFSTSNFQTAVLPSLACARLADSPAKNEEPFMKFLMLRRIGMSIGRPPNSRFAGSRIEHAEGGRLRSLRIGGTFRCSDERRFGGLVEKGIALDRKPPCRPRGLRSGNHIGICSAIELFYQSPRYAPGIHPTAIIAKSARIGEGRMSGVLLC